MICGDGMCVLFSGLKPGQRKVLFTCLKRNDKREVKVAQLAGSVAEMSAYHHGEVQSTQCVKTQCIESSCNNMEDEKEADFGISIQCYFLWE